MSSEKNISLRERFDKRGFSPAAYAKAHGVERAVMYDIFNGASTGRNNISKKSGSVRRIIAQLKKDGVWVGPLPWEV